MSTNYNYNTMKMERSLPSSFVKPVIPPIKPCPLYIPPRLPVPVSSAPIKDPRKIREWFRAYRRVIIRKGSRIACSDYRAMVDFDLLRLAGSIYDRTYQISPYLVNVFMWPKPRELFVPAFRDRVVQHWLVRKLKAIMEDRYVKQGDFSYCGIKGKGTDEALRDLKVDIIKVSKNYEEEAWIGKFDLSNCYLSVPREKLKKVIIPFIRTYYKKDDIEDIIWLVSKFLDQDITKNCYERVGLIRWGREIKPGRSMFDQEPGIGLSVGDHLNMVLVNFYLSIMDDFIVELIKRNGGGYYRRYMDDFVITIKRKSNLLKIIKEVREWLPRKLGLHLHPDKVYIQEVRKGIKFLGHVIKPSRKYTGNRTIGGLYNAVYSANWLCRRIYTEFNKRRRYQRDLTKEMKLLSRQVLAINSYLGLLKQSSTYNIRRKLFDRGRYPYIYFVCTLKDDYKSILIKDKYNFKKYLLCQHTRQEKLHQSS